MTLDNFLFLSIKKKLHSSQFNDPLLYLCLIGSVVTAWSLTEEVTGLNNPFNIFLLLNSNI